MCKSARSIVGKVFVTLVIGSAGVIMAADKLVTVDCSKGQSINAELEKDKSSNLTIQISGMCTEDVVIRRDRVTLRGSDPSSDGIIAATSDPAVDAFGVALHIEAAGHVRVENLKLTAASFAGLMATNSNQRPQIEVVNCRIVGNGAIGAFLINSRILFTDCLFTGNGTTDPIGGGIGLAVSEAGYGVCERCVSKDNPGPGQGVALNLQLQSSATVSASDLEGTDAVAAAINSWVSLDDTTVKGSSSSLFANQSTHIVMSGNTLEGAFVVSNKSDIVLFGVVQAPLGEGDFNLAQHDSYVRLRGLVVNPEDPPQSSQIGHLFLYGFSNGHFRSSVLSQLTCEDESEASCNGSVSVTGASTCTACPPPE